MVRNTSQAFFHLFCVWFSHCFSQFFDGYCVIFCFVLTFFPLTLQKVRKPWLWLQIEHCWVLLSAAEWCCWEIQFQAFFHLFCVFSHWFWWILCFFLASFSPFSPLTLQKVRKPWNWLQIEHCWELLGNPIPILFPFFLSVFFFCFVQSSLFSNLFDGFCVFLASFSPFSSLTLEKVRKPWNWLQIGALLSAAECCWEIQFPSFFPFFCLCFSFVLSRIHSFSNFFDGFCVFLASFSAFSPLTLQKVRKPWNWLQIEHCWVLLGNPIPILFPLVLCVFSHCFVQISLVFQIVWWICIFFWLRSHLFHPWPWKKSGNLEIGCRLSTAECCGVCCWVLLRNPIPSPYSICFVCVCNI